MSPFLHVLSLYGDCSSNNKLVNIQLTDPFKRMFSTSTDSDHVVFARYDPKVLHRRVFEIFRI